MNVFTQQSIVNKTIHQQHSRNNTFHSFEFVWMFVPGHVFVTILYYFTIFHIGTSGQILVVTLLCSLGLSVIFSSRIIPLTCKLRLRLKWNSPSRCWLRFGDVTTINCHYDVMTTYFTFAPIQNPNQLLPVHDHMKQGNGTTVFWSTGPNASFT